LEGSEMAMVHSYARFSDPSQAAGDSLRRQQDAAVRWCEKHGHQLSDLRFHDLGKSGWRGDKQKALAAFLKAIDGGQVKAGEILLVEAVDRLSRKGVRPTQTLVNRILNAGVSIGILAPVEKLYRSDDENDIGGAIELAAFAFQASTYSENLSRRVTEAAASHRRKFKAGERSKWSAIAPAWLEWDIAENCWRQRPEVVAVIRLIFRRTIEGIGRRRIVGELNSENYPPPGGKRTSSGWNQNYIWRLLSTRSVLGELVSNSGEVLQDYYPPIISEADWRAANVAASNRRAQRGPTNGLVNLLGGILFNAKDRSAMGAATSMTRVASGERRVVRRYSSAAARDKKPGADHHTLVVEKFEDLVFKLLPMLELSTEKSEVAVLESERQYLQQEIDLLGEQIRSRSGSVATLGPLLADLGDQLAAVDRRLAETAVQPTVPTRAYREQLATMARGTAKERERLRDALRAIVRRIEVLLIKLGPRRNDRVKAMLEIEFRDGQFARGLELPDGGVAVLRGPRAHQRLGDQLAAGWEFGSSQYEAAVKLAIKKGAK